MLGSSIRRELAGRAGWSIADVPPLPWGAGAAAVGVAAREGAELLVSRAIAEDDPRWAVLWAGGAAVTASSDPQAERELEQLESALAGMRPALSAQPGGVVFYSSSAGGVYAGSPEPPFTEATPPAPLAPYGRLKLRSEAMIADFGRSIGADSLIGRMANLYGPGQRLDKLQGLISHIALAGVTSTPVSVYVSFDTLRDYLYIDDAARLVLDAVERLLREGGAVTKILASGTATTIAELLEHFRAVTGESPRAVPGSSATAAYQAYDLRLRSTVWPEIDAFRPTTLREGIRATIDDIESAVQNDRR